MITFKTQFPVNNSKKIDDFLESCRAWIAGSPHSELSPQFLNIALKNGVSLFSDNELFFCSTYKAADREIAGVRYEKREEGQIRWVTDVVGTTNGESFLVSVQLTVDSELPVERIDQGKRPYILKRLMHDLGGGLDGNLRVGDTPVTLKDDDISLAADIICANANCTMPVIYISVNNENKPFIDAEQTAKWLSGMAHVLLEPSRSFSFKLMRQVYGENAYGGAVGIYWPDGIGKWLFLPNESYDDPKEMQIAISRKIRSSLLSQRTKRECTWSNLQEKISKMRLQELIDSGSKDVDDYVKHFGTELEAKDDEIKRLEAELLRARYVRNQQSSDDDNSSTGLHIKSNEKDLYQAERLDMVIDALKVAAESAEEHSRRHGILLDLISNNNRSGERDQILDRLKPVLRQYTSMTSTTRAELEDLGFEILTEGKHYKLIYRSDARYPFILSKSGSEYRGGMNAFTDLKRRIF